MPALSAADAAAIAGGRLVGDGGRLVGGFGADSRALMNGFGFVAIDGGHAHAASALEAGAPFAVVEDVSVLPDGASAVVVGSCEDALARLAAWWRDRLTATVVGVTGSTGKTLTKDLIAAALRRRFVVHATHGSYNAEIGLPLTVLSCPDDAQVLVAEVAARHRGEIAALAAISRPHAGVVTGIGVTHLGEFGSREAIARTKAELLESLPADGFAILPSTDDYLSLLAGSTASRVITVGPGGAVRARRMPHRLVLGAPSRAADVDLGGVTVQLYVPQGSRALLRNAMMALAVAARLGVSPREAAESLATAHLSSGRMSVVAAGKRVVVDDAYNSNPASAAAALRTTAELADGRPSWALLGGMAELGPIGHAEHLRIGLLAAALGFERVVAVGADAAAIAEGARGEAVDTIDDALALAAQAPADAVVLVKASRSYGLDRLVSALERAWVV